MKLDYRRLGRYVLIANLLVTGLVIYVAVDFMPGEAAPVGDSRLFAPVKPVTKAEPQRKGIFHDYSIITADRFLPRLEAGPGEATPLVPIPGPSSALDRLMKLRGTAVSSEKSLSFAIIELLQSREFRTVKTGDEIVGATVLDISEDSVLVSMENEEITVFLNATEEYGGASRKRSERDRKRPRDFRRRPGEQFPSLDRLPPQVQELIRKLPPDKRQMWENASPEEKRKYIKKFMESRKQQGGRDGGSRSPRAAPRKRR